MAVSVVMPALEMAQETGKLLSWRKKEGDRVSKGEPLLEIETDKAVVEIEAPGDGILAAVTAREGDVIPVGQTIAWLVKPGETPPADEAPAVSGRTMATQDPASLSNPANSANLANPSNPAEIKISPKARRLAKDKSVDIARLKGSGPGGEILAEDILAAATAAPSSAGGAPASSGVEALTSTGRLMAERTTRSWTTVPHFFLTRDVDATALNAAREGSNDAASVKITHTDLLVSIVARALSRHPRMNASWAGEGVRTNPDINVAIAMAVDNAVVTGVVHHADRAVLSDIAVRRRELTDRARASKLQPSDISGATFTISNLGMYHIDRFTAIIVPPQAGILAVGAIADRVVAVDGKPAVRPVMTLTLSCDHRVVDGARGAEFLNDVVEGIQSAATSRS